MSCQLKKTIESTIKKLQYLLVTYVVAPIVMSTKENYRIDYEKIIIFLVAHVTKENYGVDSTRKQN